MTLSSDSLDRLETLLGLWLRYGPVMNLSSARTRPELLVHVRDGLDAVWVVREVIGQGSLAWLDFGSGGGFPGLVVAAVEPGPVALVEPRQKRVAFLEIACGSIERKSVEIHRGRFERSTWDENPLSAWISGSGARNSVLSARAVWEPEEWLSVARHVGGARSHVVMHVKSAEQCRDFGAVAVVDGDRGKVAVVPPESPTNSAVSKRKN